MISAQEQGWLLITYEAAIKSGHIYPAMAACEAALESDWGRSVLAVKALNVFGCKQHVHPEYGTLNLPTREFLDHAWVTVEAAWIEFPDLATCFTDRMATLTRLAPHYPHYAAALAAKDPVTYINQVSMSWSTDPQRATKVLSIYHAHAALLTPPTAAAA
jgi:flagellum-specific peptidoglycan hydrolase FlgJ